MNETVVNSYELIYNKNIFNPYYSYNNIKFVDKLKIRLYNYSNLDKPKIKYLIK